MGSRGLFSLGTLQAGKRDYLFRLCFTVGNFLVDRAKERDPFTSQQKFPDFLFFFWIFLGEIFWIFTRNRILQCRLGAGNPFAQVMLIKIEHSIGIHYI